MDEQNPAVTHQTRVNPAFLEEVGASPAAAAAWARKMWLVNAQRQHQRIQTDPNLPASVRQAFLEHLSKVGDMGKPAVIGPNGQAGGGFGAPGFSVNINFGKKDAPSLSAAVQDAVDVQVTPVSVIPEHTNRQLDKLFNDADSSHAHTTLSP